MSKKTTLLAAMLVATVWTSGSAETILVQGEGLSRTIRINGKDVVKLMGAESTLTIEGNGDILNLLGSDNRVVVSGSLNGIVVTGSDNTLMVTGVLNQLDVRSSGNQITLDGSCDLIQYGGSDNDTTWIQRPETKQPKVERLGTENLFKVSKP